jgi:hypothetical protein
MSHAEIRELPIRDFGGIPETAPLEGERNAEWYLRMEALLNRMVTKDLQQTGATSSDPQVGHHKFMSAIANIADQIFVGGNR